MKKNKLSKSQKRDLTLFNMILECDGWVDPCDTEKRMDAGEDMSPEGIRRVSNHEGVLEARFHAPVNMISLRISDIYHNNKVQFHFLYDNKPERLLEWLAAVSDTLSLSNYPELLKQANGTCEMILLELSDSEIYEVKPPAEV